MILGLRTCDWILKTLLKLLSCRPESLAYAPFWYKKIYPPCIQLCNRCIKVFHSDADSDTRISCSHPNSTLASLVKFFISKVQQNKQTSPASELTKATEALDMSCLDIADLS